jgi:hypothetical protein
MSKKDYEVVARVLRTNLNVDEFARRTLAEDFAREFAATNPQFNRATFLRACGVEG